MAMQASRTESRFNVAPEVFDRVHLARYTMNSVELEREIIGLFLAQLPDTVAMIVAAETAADWRLATHTLKGSAMAIGARRLTALAIELEAIEYDVGVNGKSHLMEALHSAVAEFQGAVRQVYG